MRSGAKPVSAHGLAAVSGPALSFPAHAGELPPRCTAAARRGSSAVGKVCVKKAGTAPAAPTRTCAASASSAKGVSRILQCLTLKRCGSILNSGPIQILDRSIQILIRFRTEV